MLRSASIVARLHIRAQVVRVPRTPLHAAHLSSASVAFGRQQRLFGHQSLTTRGFAMDVETKAGKSRTALHETGDGGAFVRKDSVYRGWIEEGGEFPPEGVTCCSMGSKCHGHTCMTDPGSMHA